MESEKSLTDKNRRNFLKGLSLTVGALTLGLPHLASATGHTGKPGSRILHDSYPNPQQKDKLGIALVGLGQYSTGQLAPALQQTDDCYLAGVVTGTPAKAEEWKRRYNIPDKNVYNYDNYDEIASNPDIDIIYIVLPNSMHAEYTIRAAKAGKHVICEKPMATSVEDCQRMMDACKQNNVKLSIGYRLHFEPHNKRVMELGQQKEFGAVQRIEGANSMVVDGDPDIWRLDKKLSGGGPLMDVGIYAVQGACYTMGMKPDSVTASFGKVTRPDYFDDVEQSISWKMEFPGGVVADCKSSYNESASRLYGKAKNGWWELDPAYSYAGIKGKTHKGPMNLPHVNQQARQMDDFAQCVKTGRETPVPGEMGKRDVEIMMAIYEAARTGNKVKLS